MKHVIVDTVVIHTVRGSDLDTLTGFATRHTADGYEATEPRAVRENEWALSIRRSANSDLGPEEIETRCAAAGIIYERKETEHVMRDNATHDSHGAIKLSAKPSGADYVVVRDKDAPESGKLLLMTPDKCNHGVTICRECADSWEIDYEVRYSDTIAGRELSRQRTDADAESSPAHEPPVD
ncbi:hypothetical protein [Nocardia wallacei]|uniref:hypothetical protein n=1 Tax=Nocardia wallacei TaxID=480035 RepID=UPI002457EA80|nr:hypothetical protein [Nocardia wallacei]